MPHLRGVERPGQIHRILTDTGQLAESAETKRGAGGESFDVAM